MISYSKNIVLEKCQRLNSYFNILTKILTMETLF